ncbi:MAG: GNAT family N-acetyltransferase [Acetanaerobacterium sp.]
MDYTVKWGHDAVYRDAAALRTEVFVDEQEFCEEFDELDKTAHHMVIYDADGAPVATGRLFDEDGGLWHVGRICVVKRMRGTGLGRIVVEQLEIKAHALGAQRIILGAQKRVRGFYETLGYRVCGDEYFEEYCAHLPMDKALGTATERHGPQI